MKEVKSGIQCQRGEEWFHDLSFFGMSTRKWISCCPAGNFTFPALKN